MNKSIGFAAVMLVASQSALAQDPRASPPLPSLPQVYETADLKIRVEKVADGLANPWSLAWLPNGDLLITERAGRLRMFRNGAHDPKPITSVPKLINTGTTANYLGTSAPITKPRMRTTRKKTHVNATSAV